MIYTSHVRADQARSKSFAHKRLILASASIAILGVALAQPAFAQSSDQPAAGDATPQSLAPTQPGATGGDVPNLDREIVVTGSRIARRDFTATSPIVTVDSALIEKTSSVNLEANLNKLPQFAPSLTQFSSDNIQSSANTTLGASTVSLRQLGSNRNLVLLDGRRGTPINGSGVIDINTIPSAAIQRVEIITGGASSTYGADAVGGVVNFILKKNFQGLEADGQVSETQYGDGREYRLSAITGANFSDGRGNVLLGLEYFNREKVLRTDRKAYRKLFSSPTTSGTGTQGLTDNYITFNTLNPSRAAIDSVFVPKGETAGQIPTNATFLLNNDDSLYVNTSLPATSTQAFTPVVYGYNGGIDGLYRKKTAANLLAENNIQEVLSIPQDRYSLFTKAHYDFSENVSFFTQGTFAKTSTISVSQFAPAVSGWGTLIPHGSAVYTGNTALNIPSSLNGDGTTNVAYRPGGRFGLNCGPTGGCTNNDVFPVSPELTALLNSRVLPVVAGETPAAYAARLAANGCTGTPTPGAAASAANCAFTTNMFLKQLGERRTVNKNLSFQLLAGFQGKIPYTSDWTYEVFGSHGETVAKTDQLGFGSVQRWRAVLSSPNYGVGFNATGNAGVPGNNFEGANATCTSGVSPFKQDQSWSDDCKNAIVTNTQNENRVTQTQFQGNIQGGLFNLPYGQLRFAAGFEYRKNTIHFDADSSATQGTSFLEGVIGIFPQGNTQGSTNVKEVYGEMLVPLLKDLPFAKSVNLELGYRHSKYNSIGSVGTYKINGDWQVNDWLTFRGGYQKASRAPNLGELFTAATQTLDSAAEGDPCSTRNPSNPAFIGAYSANPTLNPTNAAKVQALCTQIMGATGAAFYYDPANLNNQSNVAAASAFLSLVGNPNLKQENATTYTIGGVLRSPFESPWVRGFRMSVDYYHVKLTNAISQQGQDGIYRRCFSTAYNPTLALNAFCALISRNPANGIPSTVNVTFTNGGAVTTAGVDGQVDWSLRFKDVGLGLPGTFSLNVLVNYLDKFKTTTDNGIIPLIDYAGTLGGGQVGTNAGAFRWKSFTTATYAVGPATASLQWRHLPKTKASIAATIPDTTFIGAPAYDIFDLSGTFAVSRAIGIRFGVDNLFNKQPPLTTYNPQAVLPTLPGGSYNSGYYDVLGRRFYFGAKFKF
jgi:outer membrane receptor protein involved in Fe transport